MKIIFSYPFYVLCYHERQTVLSTRGRYLQNVGGVCFKLAVTVLVKYLTWAFIYLDVYVTIHSHTHIHTHIYIYIYIYI